VNDYLQTTNHESLPLEIGLGGPQFTHAADAMARICVQNRSSRSGRSAVGE